MHPTEVEAGLQFDDRRLRQVKRPAPPLRDARWQVSRSSAMSIIPLNLETDTVELPAPVLPRQASLDEALKRRRSTRSFISDSLSMATLSALLWAAFGVNR